MQSRINGNLNFQGSFLINYNKTPQSVRDDFEEQIGKKKKIFYNWEKNKDTVLYIVKDNCDSNLARIVRDKNIDFKYYPELSIKSEISAKNKKELANYLKQESTKVIDKIDELVEFIRQNRYENSSVPQINTQKIKNVLKKMDVNVDGEPYVNNKGIINVKDDSNGRLAIISPESQHGVRYVHIVPQKAHWNSEFYAIDQKGNILKQYTSPDAIIAFNNGFNRAVKHYMFQV